MVDACHLFVAMIGWPAHPLPTPARSCKAEQLVMVGDRFLTDVVFGNRNGMLTVRPAPFTSKGEPKAVLLVRGRVCVVWWCGVCW